MEIGYLKTQNKIKTLVRKNKDKRIYLKSIEIFDTNQLQILKKYLLIQLTIINIKSLLKRVYQAMD